MIKLAKDYYVKEENIDELYKRHRHSIDASNSVTISEPCWFAKIKGNDTDVLVEDRCVEEYLGLFNACECCGHSEKDHDTVCQQFESPHRNRNGIIYNYICCSCKVSIKKHDEAFVDDGKGGCVGNIYCKKCKRDTDVFVVAGGLNA